MTEQTFARLFSKRVLFVLIVCTVLFFHLLPLETSPRRWVGPDLILAFALAWSARRPEYVPSIWLAALFLMTDLLLFRPPGLWAACALLACESMKIRSRSFRDGNFLSEWFTACAFMVLIAIGYRAVMLITLLEPPAFGLSVFELLMTMMFYPVVVAVTHGILGVRHSAPGEVDSAQGSL